MILRSLALWFALCALARADTPGNHDVPLVAVSESQSCFVTMAPGKYRFEGDKIIVERRPLAAVYRLREDGSLQKLWQMRDWYSFRPYLADDCEHLVTIENGFFGHEPKPNHFGIAFFARGKLLRQHRVSDLVRDNSKLRRSASHYMWLALVNPSPVLEPERRDSSAEMGFEYDGSFRLKTVDGVRYLFDPRTGDVKEASGKQ